MFPQLEEFLNFDLDLDCYTDQKQIIGQDGQKCYGFFSSKTNTFYELDQQSYRQALYYFKNKEETICSTPRINLQNDRNQESFPVLQSMLQQDVWNYYAQVYNNVPSMDRKIDLQQIDI